LSVLARSRPRRLPPTGRLVRALDQLREQSLQFQLLARKSFPFS
jgi:hypothetical protein